MPIPNPFAVGDAVLASRAQDGQNHEEATVIDAHSLLIAGDDIPMVSVEFPDGQRLYLRSLGDDVMTMPEPEEAGGEGEDDDR